MPKVEFTNYNETVFALQTENESVSLYGEALSVGMASGSTDVVDLSIIEAGSVELNFKNYWPINDGLSSNVLFLYFSQNEYKSGVA